MTVPDTRAGRLPLFGVRITDLTVDEALAWMRGVLERPDPDYHSVYFANAHTLNLAAEDPEYAAVLNGADHVFGDGTGVRWAARWLHRVRLKGNVNGTDVVPLLFDRCRDLGLSYFLLGSQPSVVAGAAAHLASTQAGWRQVGYHHGHLDPGLNELVLEKIRRTRPDVLLVGMGNPVQERWIAEYGRTSGARLCIAVGGLFHYWSGDLDRAPSWMRRAGFEWLHLLGKQPHKARRYVLGNPAFLVRTLGQRGREQEP